MKLTIRTSLSVNFDCQSLFNVSTQTLPVDSSTLGCHMRVLKEAFGGLFGKSSGILRCSFHNPWEYGVPVGPVSNIVSWVRSSGIEVESPDGGNR